MVSTSGDSEVGSSPLARRASKRLPACTLKLSEQCDVLCMSFQPFFRCHLLPSDELFLARFITEPGLRAYVFARKIDLRRVGSGFAGILAGLQDDGKLHAYGDPDQQLER